MHPVDRRQFLSASGAALTPFALGCTGLGLVPPSEKIGIATIGIGVRTRGITRRILKDERVRVLAICDVVKARRDAGKADVDKAYKNTDCKAYVDYRDVLARDDIDAVIIGTPDHWHTTQVIHAAQAKKDIYCEKPLTHTLHEGKLIIDAVKKHGVVFQTGSQQRTEFGHKFVKAAEYIRNGRLGDVLAVHVGVGDPPRQCDLPEEPLPDGIDWDRWLGPAALRPYNKVLCPDGVHGRFPQWRRYWEYAGGGLADMGAHHFDIVQWALKMDASGPIAALPPRQEGRKRGATLVYGSGITVGHGGPAGATFIGTKGMITVGRGHLSSTPGKILKQKLGEKDEKLPRHKNHMEDWLSCIASRKTPICSAEIGARSAAVCQLAGLAYRHGRKITWDPERWTFAGDEPKAWLDYDRREGYRLPAV